MQVLLPERVAQRMTQSLREAGSQEIGGILMGEHVADAVYRIRDITIQSHGGTFASFIRGMKGILSPLRRFFHETDYNYKRFNYLGEWHSHPSFVLEPSGRDCQTIWEIVEDPRVGANFAVLLIVRLADADRLEGTVTVFYPGRQPFRGDLMLEKVTPL